MSTARERAREAAVNVVEWFSGRHPACSEGLAADEIARLYIAPLARDEVRRALEDAIQVLWERVEREEYGHAKAAVALDIEALRTLASTYEQSESEDTNT